MLMIFLDKGQMLVDYILGLIPILDLELDMG